MVRTRSHTRRPVPSCATSRVVRGLTAGSLASLLFLLPAGATFVSPHPGPPPRGTVSFVGAQATARADTPVAIVAAGADSTFAELAYGDSWAAPTRLSDDLPDHSWNTWPPRPPHARRGLGHVVALNSSASPVPDASSAAGSAAHTSTLLAIVAADSCQSHLLDYASRASRTRGQPFLS